MTKIKLIISLFVIPCFLICGAAEAASMHAVLVFDSNDKDIGSTLEIDLKKINDNLSTIEKNTGLEINKTVLSHADATPNGVLDAIDSLEVEEDDVIFFVFGGHGFSLESKDDGFPHMFFGETFQGCDFYALTNKLLEKEPRLLISLSDCCNSLIPEEYNLEIVEHRSFFNWWQSPDYTTLFLETEGVLVGTGATKGEYALCDNWKGGYFTHAFCKSLEKEVYESEPQWENVIDSLIEKVGLMSDHEQTPFCIFIPERPSKKIDICEYINN